MRILIVGGTSSISKALKPVLTSFSEVILAGRKNCDILLDLANPIEEIDFPGGIDVVVHTAAHFGGKADNEIFDAENVNVLGTLKLCQLAKRSGAKHFIYISTIFSTLAKSAANHSIYALSKKHAEELAEFYCNSHALPLTVLRPSQIYGNDKSFERHQPFFYSMIDKAQRGQDIYLYGSNDPIRNYIHVEDLIAIIVKTIQTHATGNYSCAYNEEVTYSQIAKAAYAAFGSDGKVIFLKDKPDIPDSTYDKTDELYKRIGFYPQISIDEGMKQIAKYRNSIS